MSQELITSLKYTGPPHGSQIRMINTSGIIKNKASTTPQTKVLPEARARSKVSPRAAPCGKPATERGERGVSKPRLSRKTLHPDIRDQQKVYI